MAAEWGFTMKEFDRIIFVGRAGNSREVMAAELLKRKGVKNNPEILARGTSVLFPEPLNQKAEAVLISNGITLNEFSSTALTEEDFGENTLILTFESAMRESLFNIFEHPKNVHILTQVTGDELEIFDPTGQEIVTYGLCYEALDKTTTKLADVLNEGTYFDEIVTIPDTPEEQA